MLGQIYGRLNAPSDRADGHWVAFDQREFFADGSAYAHGLSDTGYAYIPGRCDSRTCRVHIAFHACRQNADEVGDAFYRHGGYNRWADSNDIIVLYPQTTTRYGWGFPFWTLNFVWNLYACWDWWGYDGDDYPTRNGSQIKAVRAMLDRLAGARRDYPMAP
ncbi:PHB depolymerase family esterase [Methylomagnum ishizawai]|uniref:PHB depolymerase family esterase n=1 Tax=Methylomagnum ishizawai TaxID=1760988 RepID=UPI001C33FA05|nr:PHB depolymerase family esterase [Methylomagnum ishizawai]BBL77308.1 hypothetical protein MishRS11D_44060 [Methylomagnum ishizawai]